jgi:hypothetical protein
VAEVKAESFQADAAYGHTGGGTVNVVLKSGANQFHGTAYEFNQISNTAATPFFTNKVGGKKPGSRFEEPRINYSEGFDSTTLGFPAYLSAASPRKVMPRIQFSRFTGLGDEGGREFPFDSFQIFETFTKITGKHTLKFGADIRQLRENDFNYGLSNGTSDVRPIRHQCGPIQPEQLLRFLSAGRLPGQIERDPESRAAGGTRIGYNRAFRPLRERLR